MSDPAPLPDIGRLVLVVPTYNEAANLEPLVARIRAAVPAAHVLVVDDGSPDGTGEVADRLAMSDTQVAVLHRPRKEGLGKAYISGFRRALEDGYDVIGEIDADGSHQPEQLPRLVRALADADLVIGSRYVPGGEVEDWSYGRVLLSGGGNVYTRLLLGMPVRDLTAGYRLFRREALEKINLDEVQSVGYVFQADMTVRAVQCGLRVVEVPITFRDRQVGESKMTPDIAVESLRRITRWGFATRRRQAARALSRARHRARGRRDVGGSPAEDGGPRR